MTSWFVLSEGVPWQSASSSAVELDYRFGHLGPRRAHHCGVGYSPQNVHGRPSDGGPPARWLNLQAFAVWAERRRIAPPRMAAAVDHQHDPDPGVSLAFTLFGQTRHPDAFLIFSPSTWRAAVWSVRSHEANLPGDLHVAICGFSLACGDAPRGGDLSVPLTMDIVWFFARGAMVLHWMDLDRSERLDATEVLPVVPACRELLLLATMRLAHDRGLPSRVARRFFGSLLTASHETGCSNDRDHIGDGVWQNTVRD